MAEPYQMLQVNLSPNLSSTRHKPLAGLFINVMNDLVRLVGFGPGELHCSLTLHFRVWSRSASLQLDYTC